MNVTYYAIAINCTTVSNATYHPIMGQNTPMYSCTQMAMAVYNKHTCNAREKAFFDLI